MTEATQSQPGTPRPPPPEDGASADPMRDLQDRLGPQFEQAQAQLMEVNERVKDFIRKNPGSVLLGAAAVGFLVGKWASRR